MHESSGSQFFRVTTGIQLGPDTSDESRFIMTFLTIFRVQQLVYVAYICMPTFIGVHIIWICVC